METSARRVPPPDEVQLCSEIAAANRSGEVAHVAKWTEAAGVLPQIEKPVVTRLWVEKTRGWRLFVRGRIAEREDLDLDARYAAFEYSFDPHPDANGIQQQVSSAAGAAGLAEKAYFLNCALQDDGGRGQQFRGYLLC